MEASDSDYFESADEDVQSDDEDTQTVKSNENSEVTDLKGLKIVEIGSNETSSSSNNNKTSETTKNANENNVTNKEANRAIVKKLGSKVNKNDEIHNKVKEVPLNNPETVRKEHEIKESAQPSVVDVQNENKDTLLDQPEIDITESVKPNTVNTQNEIKNQPKNEMKESAKPNVVDTDVNETLWDDTEINWGAEQEDNMWNNDDWEPIDEPQELKSTDSESQVKKEETSQSASSWSSWGTWGVSSIISTATQGVSTITQGISSVLESGIGVPEPEEMARLNQVKGQSETEEGKTGGFNLENLVMGVSHLTKLVESTGTKVISGGLDTLETIGKKTMEVLQEGDPGLKKKRAFLKIDQDKPVLSQLLREAKEKAEEENKLLEQRHFVKKAKNYEALFDDHQGLVHLEALEMLSKQCDIKIQTLLESNTGDSLTDLQETLDQVKELCELPDDEEEEHTKWNEIVEKLNLALSEINIPISYKKLIETWEETEVWLSNLKLDICDERELHQQAVETLAQLTALAVEQFHKTGELLLVKEHRSTADEADSLVQLTTSLTSLIGIVAGKFSDKLNIKSASNKNKEEMNGLITNVFFEAANSSSYIQDAFQLLIPVLQVGAV